MGRIRAGSPHASGFGEACLLQDAVFDTFTYDRGIAAGGLHRLRVVVDCFCRGAWRHLQGYVLPPPSLQRTTIVDMLEDRHRFSMLNP